MLEATLILVSYAACAGFGAVYIRRFVKTRSRGQLWTGLALVAGPPWLVFLYALASEAFLVEGNALVAIVCAYLLCALVSVVFFRRFLKTQSRRSLWTGLSLLFGPPGLAIFFVAVTTALNDDPPPEPGFLCYMPSGLGGQSQIVQPQTDEDRERWGGLAGKYSGRVSTETFHKLSGGIFEEAPSNVDNALKAPGK
ncbi:MAG: hypothetical protein PHV33_05275 [Elusimicrobiales bacterium]|nr:hypothetical protein [Elusimicrobiales bacterium]